MHIARGELHNQEREKVEYWSFPDLYAKYKNIFQHYFTERLTRIKQFQPGLKTLFDAGCGYGFWLDFCQERGIEVKGIDILDEAVGYARREFNLDAEKYSLEDYTFDRKYDAIVICDLLEHLAEPNGQLRKIREALQERGVLFVQVPNLLGFKLPAFHGFGLPYHIWQFDIHTLSMLLNKNGFRVLKWWTGVLGVIGVYESGGPNICDNIIWQLARHLKIGNRLMVAAKKE